MSTQEDYVKDNSIKDLAEAIINKLPNLRWIIEYDLLDKIGYVRSYQDKKSNKPGMVFADARKVTGPFKAYIPYDILICIYDRAFSILSENQQKIVILHELLHIGTTDDGDIKLNDHTIQDFYSILDRFGINWDRVGVEVPDILVEDWGEKDG